MRAGMAMAREIKTEKKKKKSRKKKIFVILLIIVMIGVIGYFGYQYLKGLGNKDAVEIKVLDSNDVYGYSLKDNDSKYYQQEYENLKNILKADSVDSKEYATQVAKMFVIDLYTMTTKVNKYDIGGSEFFYKDKEEMFEQKVMDTLYYSLLDNTYGDRKQELPEVKEVTIESFEATTYELNGEDVDAYLIKLKISYVKDLKYDSVASVVVCQESDGIRWSVVDYQPTLSPKY